VAATFHSGPPANLSTTSEDAVRFVVTPQEISAGRWITGAAGTHLLYADRYGQLRITAAPGRSGGILTEVLPRTLDQYAWILADQSNFVDGTVRAEEGNFYSLYRWPAFIDEFWNRVYSNGDAAAYSRNG
jgi:hypothetical protein